MRKILAVVSLGFLAFGRGAILPAAPGTPLCPAADSSEAMSPPEPLVATPCVNGFAGSYPCSNVDLLSVLTLSDMECASGNSLWGWTDLQGGKEYALMGCNNGISFVDISTPDSPIYLGRLPTHTSNSLWRDVRVYANYAFIVSEASGHGMQVFDLTQLRNVPSPPVIFTETAHYGGFGHAHTIAINEATGFAYACGSSTCSGGLHMVNIQDPVNPAGAGCVSSDGYTHETQCVIYAGPDTAYQGHEICFSSNEDTLTIVDVTDKGAPVQLSRTGYSGSGYVHQGWLTGDQVHFLLDDELDELDFGHNTYTYIWDVSDLASPVLMGHYTGPTAAIDHNQYIRGSYAYQATYRAGLRILDLSGIANARLSEAAFFDIYPDDDAPEFNGAWNNYPFFPSGNVIVSGIEQGLFVLQPHLNPYPTSLSIDDVSVVEGDSGTVSATFTVSLSVATPQTVTVNYATADGSATAGSDYTSTSGVLTFSPGTTSQPVTVLVNGDLLNEADEFFYVNLSDPINGTIGDPKGVGMILNDDPVPSLSIDDVAVTEGNSGTVAATFTVSLSAPSGLSASAHYATADGTATAGSDYTAGVGNVSFSPGTTVQIVTVLVNGDLLDETDEVFFVNLSNPINATIADGQGICSIIDDDTLTVSAISPSSGPSGGTGVTIAGTSFESGASVTIGDVLATNVAVLSATQITATTPSLSPGTSNDVVITIPNTTTTTLQKGFFSDFLDVPVADPFHDFIVAIFRDGITAGCGGGDYCPGSPVTRAQMAVFLLRGEHGSGYTPPACTAPGLFGDVSCPSSFAVDWIEQLYNEGITGGCSASPLLYCPDNPVTRAQMAVFLLRAEHGSGYAPPTCAAPGIFGDVNCPAGFAVDWIEELYLEGVTGGCSASPLLYCPDDPNTRGQMAVFLTKTFGLQ